MKIYNILIICFVLLLSNSIQAQYSKIYLANKNTAPVDASIDEETKAEILNIVEQKVNDYNRCGRFADADGIIDQSLMDCFVGLFNSGGTHYNDLQNLKQNITVGEYIAMINDHLSGGGNASTSGLEYDLSADLISIVKTPSGDYNVNLAMIKKNKIQLSKDYNLLPYNSKGVIYKLSGTLLVNKDDIENMQFTSINGEEARVIKDGKSLLSVHGKYGLLGNLSSYSGNGFTAVQPSVKSYGLGLEYHKSVGGSQTLFLSTGLAASFNNISTDITNKYKGKGGDGLSGSITAVDYSNNNSTNVNQVTKQTVDSLTSGSESLKKSNILSLSLGLMKQIKMGDDALCFRVAAAGTYFTGTAQGERVVNGKGYQIPINPNFPQTINELNTNAAAGSYNFSSKEVENLSGITTPSNFSFGLVLSPTYHKVLNYTYGLDFGLDYYLGLSNLLKYENKQDPFLSKPDVKTSIVSDYFDKSALNQLNVRLGIVIIFKK